MITVTTAATTRLQSIPVDHPEDPITRITVSDLDRNSVNSAIEQTFPFPTIPTLN